MYRTLLGLIGCLAFVGGSAANAQFLMMPDSTNNRLVLFDPNNGSLVNSNFFSLAGGTPIHAMQVGSEIWVSEQVGDRVSRWSMGGASLGAITGQMDNVRGMIQVGNTVYVCNDGTGNGAPGPSLRMFDTAGNNLGFFVTPASSGPFGLLDSQGGLLVSSDAANDDIHQYTLAGASVGTFHNSATLNFAEQMDYDPAGNILVAAFTSNMVFTLNFNTGAIVSSFAASGARGVYQLGNGNVMWTNGSGAHVYDINTGISTQVYTGGGRFIDFVNIPAPGSIALLGIAGLIRRRRRND